MKPIIFTGDSFTFGEGLELYDSKFHNFIKQNFTEQNYNYNNSYNWSIYDNVSWAGSASNIRNKYKFPTLVSDELNTLFLSKWENGGDNIESLEFVEKILKVYSNEDFSCIVMNLTDLYRDEFQIGKTHIKEKLGIKIPDGNTKRLEPFMINWFRWDNENNSKKFIDNKNEYSSYFDNNLDIGDAQKLQDEYLTYEKFEKDMHRRTYYEMVDKIKKINIPIYFIGHWSRLDQEVLLKLNDDIIQKNILNNIIPLYVDGKRYESISDLPNTSDLFINRQFPWTKNNHPTKYLHECIADSVTNFLKQKI